MSQPQVMRERGLNRISVDYIMIGGDVSPGKATVHGALIQRGWDIRKGYASTGATLAPTGDQPAKFGIRFEFFEDEEIDAWEVFAKKYFSAAVRFEPGTIKPRALGIAHPLLNSPPLSISEVVVEEVSQLEQDDTGLWSTEVKFIQYRKPVQAADPPKASIPAAIKTAPTAEDAADREQQEKLATFLRLAGIR